MITDPESNAISLAGQSAHRASLAAERVGEIVTEEHRRLNLPIIEHRGGKIVEVSPFTDRVFVSYTRETPQHIAKVTRLVKRLKDAGITVAFDGDQPPGGPNLGWTAWSENEAEFSPRVLAVFTATYEKCWHGEQPPGTRDGATWEAATLANRCYSGGSAISFMRPVIFEDADAGHIPHRIKSLTRFHGERDFDGILAWLRAMPVTAGPADPEPLPAAIPPGTFRTGQPATGHYFVGRTGGFRDLYRMLETRRGISLVGDSCIGKSSLLLKWRELACIQGHQAHIVDFQQVAATCGSFLTSATGGAVCGTAEMDAETAADHLQSWATRQKLPPLVLVDESEEAIRALDYRFFERLRGMAGNVIFALASRVLLNEVFTDATGRTSPFMNLLDTLKLGLLEEPAAQELADRAGEQAGLLRLWAGAHPYHLQCLGSLLDRTDLGTGEALNRYRDTAYQRLEEAVRRYGPKARQALAAACNGLRPDHHELKSRGLLNPDGSPFGKILVKWMEDRE